MIRVNLERFIWYRDFQTKKQVFYIEDEKEFRFFMQSPELIVATRISKEEIFKDLPEDSDLARDFALYAFKKTYLGADAIQVDEYYLPLMVSSEDFEKEKPKMQEAEELPYVETEAEEVLEEPEHVTR